MRKNLYRSQIEYVLEAILLIRIHVLLEKEARMVFYKPMLVSSQLNWAYDVAKRV